MGHLRALGRFPSFTGAGGLRRFEDQAAAGDRAFGFLQLGDVDQGRRVARFGQLFGGVREIRRVDPAAAGPQDVGGVHLARVDLDLLVISEEGAVDPLRLDQQDAVGDRGDRALEVQAVEHRHAAHQVAVVAEQPSQLLDAGDVRTGRAAGEDHFADPQHVAAVERAGRLDGPQRPVGRERRRHRGDLAAARLGARPGHYRHLVGDDGHVFDENRIGMRLFGRQRQSRQPSAASASW